MGNAISEGLINSNTSLMRYSLYGTLTTINREKKINERREKISRTLLIAEDKNDCQKKKSGTWKKPLGTKNKRKNARSTERVLEADVEAMLSTFNL